MAPIAVRGHRQLYDQRPYKLGFSRVLNCGQVANLTQTELAIQLWLQVAGP